MTDENKRRLMEAGIDVDDALARLMQNEGLFLRLLRAFLQDGNFARLQEALAKGDVSGAFTGGRTRSRAWRQSFDEGSVCAVSEVVECLAGRRSRRCRGKDACRGGGVSQGGGRAQCGRIRLGFVLAEKWGIWRFSQVLPKKLCGFRDFYGWFKEFNR